jgi:hypothetical protein
MPQVAARYVSSYCCYICVLILLEFVSETEVVECLRLLLDMCPHTTTYSFVRVRERVRGGGMPQVAARYVSSYCCYICVLILLEFVSETEVVECLRLLLDVSSYYYMLLRILQSY